MVGRAIIAAGCLNLATYTIANAQRAPQKIGPAVVIENATTSVATLSGENRQMLRVAARARVARPVARGSAIRLAMRCRVGEATRRDQVTSRARLVRRSPRERIALTFVAFAQKPLAGTPRSCALAFWLDRPREAPVRLAQFCFANQKTSRGACRDKRPRVARDGDR